MTKVQFTGIVKGLSLQGLGVVEHPDGQVFFVSGVWTGDEGEFEIISREKRYGFAKLLHLSKSSPSRTTPKCKHHGVSLGSCGGCPWQFVKYADQLKEKEYQVGFQLKRAKLSLDHIMISPIIPSSKEYGYRNRCQLKTDGENIGFVSHSSNSLATIETCPILNPSLEKLVTNIHSMLPRTDWKPQPPYIWNFLDLDDDMPIEKLALNKRRPFKQGNSDQNQAMREWLKTKLSHEPKDVTILELFSGSGNFTEILAELEFNKIFAAEIDGAALTKLREKNLRNTKVLALDLYKGDFLSKLNHLVRSSSIIVLDPPREGFQNSSGLQKTFKNLKTIYYISCDVESFAKDASALQKMGFNLTEVTPLDQFPHTPHVEILSIFRR